MKLPGRIQSYLDELDIDIGKKAKLKKHIVSMGHSLPEHPTPKEVEKIVRGAMKNLDFGTDESADEKPKKTKKVEESTRLSFKEFLNGLVNEDITDRLPTAQKISKIKNLLNSPLLAKDALKKIYGLITDDTLLSQIRRVEKTEPSLDVRSLIKNFLKSKYISI